MTNQDEKLETFKTKFLPIYNKVYTEGEFFSASKTIEEMMLLVSEIESIAPHSYEAVQLYRTISSVASRANLAQIVILYAEKSIEINRLNQCLHLIDLFHLKYQLANAYENENEFGKSLNWLREAILDMEQLSEISVHGKLGVRQTYGYVLHQNKMFKEAFDENVKTLLLAEEHVGKEDGDLTGILTNIAQNLYELKRLNESEIYLLRCLDVAKKTEKFNIEFDMLFQLGVLNFEKGNYLVSRDYFLRRLHMAEDSQDQNFIQAAKLDLQEFESKQIENRK